MRHLVGERRQGDVAKRAFYLCHVIGKTARSADDRDEVRPRHQELSRSNVAEHLDDRTFGFVAGAQFREDFADRAVAAHNRMSALVKASKRAPLHHPHLGIQEDGFKLGRVEPVAARRRRGVNPPDAEFSKKLLQAHRLEASPDLIHLDE